jgi:MFS family permease
MDGIGSIAGALAAFFLLPIFGYRRIFWFSLIPGLLGVLFILFISERRTGTQREEKEHDPPKRGISLPSRLKLFIAASSVFAFGHFGYAFMLLRAKNIGLTDERAILLYVLFYISYTFFIIPAGMLSDSIGRKPVLAAGYMFFALLAAGLIGARSSTGLLLLFIMYGIVYGMIDGVQRAYVVDMAPEGARATALGMFHTAVGLSALPGGFIAGLLWDRLRPEATFVYAIALSLIAVVLLLSVGRTGRTERDRAAP